MSATLESVATPVAASTVGTIVAPERLHVLDILRGFAILVMVIVHFNATAATDGGALSTTIHHAVLWFLSTKGYATFAILFGVSFAIQLQRAETRQQDVLWPFLRRLLGILGFGVLVQGLIGFAVLMGYAVSGVWLLILRHWSTRALVVCLLVSGATFSTLWNVAVGSYQWATIGVERANAVYQSPRPVSPARQAANDELRDAGQDTSFPRLAAARIVRFVYLGRFTDFWGDWQRGIKGTLLDSWGNADLTLFLIGLLAMRLGVFAQPAEHRRLLVVAILVGAVLWSIDQSRLYETVWSTPSMIPVTQVAGSVSSWFGLFGHGGRYLALTYIAAITLLVAFSKAWERMLAMVFGDAGRLALTNYIVQCAVLGVVFDNYGFGATELTPQLATGLAVILFVALAVFSRLWLTRFRLGPAEWLLRSVTYARVQPLRRPATATGV